MILYRSKMSSLLFGFVHPRQEVHVGCDLVSYH